MSKKYRNSVIGAIVGPKGAGKSLLLGATIVHKLVEGDNVWSNMKVHTGEVILNRIYSPCGKKLEYTETKPLDWDLLYKLDRSLVGGTVAVDEMTYFAGSRHSMDTRNKIITTCVRQARHRLLDFLYTARKFSWVDSYLRDETDFLIETEDLAFSPWGQARHLPGGIMLNLKYYDISGAITGKSVYDQNNSRNKGWHYYKEMNFYGPPYHDCYDTHEIISIEEAFTGVKMDLKKRVISNRDDDSESLKEKILDAICMFKKSGRQEISTDAFWEYLRQTSGVIGAPSALGRLLPREVKRHWTRHGNMYDFSEFAYE